MNSRALGAVVGAGFLIGLIAWPHNGPAMPTPRERYAACEVATSMDSRMACYWRLTRERTRPAP